MHLEVRKTPKLFIAGEFVRSESGRTYQVEGRNVPRASRKDLRDAVRAARAALAGWSGRTAYNRGQVLYRVAEMLEGRRAEFARLLGGGGREVAEAVDTWVWYAGLADKLDQLGGTVNPVAGPYFDFSVPEPTGVVGVVAPEQPPLLGLVRALAPVLCAGNTAVALLSESRPLAGLCLGEVLATGDLPPGAVALLSGQRQELLPWLGTHREVNAVDAGGCSADELARLEAAAAGNLKRVVRPDGHRPSPWRALAFTELKTVWHPVGR